MSTFKNKNSLRTIEAQIVQKLKDNETGVGVAQWQEHSPLTNATWVRFLAWEARELGLRSLSNVGGFLRVLRFPPPTKAANYANI